MDRVEQKSHALSASQVLFWQGHQLNPDVPLYNMAWRFDLMQELDPLAFERAFAHVVSENDALRLAFEQDGEQPFQWVMRDGPNALQHHDFSGASSSEAALQSKLQDWIQTPFDLSKGTLRCHLAKLSQGHWVWILCQHHIACDAQSGALIFQAVSEQYLAEVNGSHSKSITPPAYLESAPFKVEPAALNSANNASKPTAPYKSKSNRTGTSERICIDIEPRIFEQIEAAIQTPEFRLFTPDLSRLALFLTAYLGFLHRITGDEVITLGLPAHNRLNADDRETIGLFVEVLPFEVHVLPDDTLKALHAKVKTALGIFLRSAKPGAVAQQDTRNVSAILNFIQAKFDTFADHPAKVEWLHSGAHDKQTPLRLHVMDFSGTDLPTLELDVAQEILEQTTSECIAEQFGEVLCTSLNAPQTPLNAIPLTQDRDHMAVLDGPSERADISVGVVALIEKAVTRYPDDLAVSSENETLSYAELMARSDAMAAHILRMGIPIGSAIAVHLPRSCDCIVAMLGVMKAGCVFVPIASNTPYGRTAQILKGCDAAAIFVTADNTFDFSCTRIEMRDASATCDVELPKIAQTDLAYILFTSGSTGLPKGASVNHQEFSRYIQWAGHDFSGAQRADYAFFSSISFDLTLTSIFTPLTLGGAVKAYEERAAPDLAVLDVFAQDAVDVVKLTPSHLALVCAQGLSVSRIRTLILGGENLTTQLCNTALRTLSAKLEIINEYGPTEAVVGAMQHRFSPHEDTGSSVPIGQPADGMQISIRDAALNLCPMAITGEIVIAGRLSEGYINQESDAFVCDPLDQAQRLYRTGDLGRLNSNGTLEYLGRADQQIKIGGVRLETAEIEHAVLTCSDVNAAHVSFRRNTEISGKPSQFCKTCGLPETYPGAEFSADGVCHICIEFESYKDRAQSYFQPEPELEKRVRSAAEKSTGRYDAIMLLSGGKDSTYAAYRLAAMTSRVLAVTLDNGYIAHGAKTNIERVTEHLGWDHRYLSTDKMNEIFVDSLKTHSNVCQGCFKAIYTLALRTARAEGVPMIVTGLSRGQFFETRLTPDLFRSSAPTCAQLDDLVSQARKTYHAEDDALSRLMDTKDLQDGRILDEVEILDLYRYIDVPVAEIYDFLTQHTAWSRPSDTGRSTNCLINDVGIHLHKTREGFHNYALPYSWDVRMGHKTRAQALEELDDEIDEDRVAKILDEIGFDEPLAAPAELTVYVAGQNLRSDQIWSALRGQLQREMLPKHVVLLDDMPLTSNGKVDTNKLPTPSAANWKVENYVTPSGEMELRLASILSLVLKMPKISATQNFFDLGVNSLLAIDIAIKANEAGIALPATALFEHRNLQLLAQFAEGLNVATRIDDDAMPLLDLDDEELANIAEAML